MQCMNEKWKWFNHWPVMIASWIEIPFNSLSIKSNSEHCLHQISGEGCWCTLVYLWPNSGVVFVYSKIVECIWSWTEKGLVLSQASLSSKPIGLLIYHNELLVMVRSFSAGRQRLSPWICQLWWFECIDHRWYRCWPELSELHSKR